jgi:hypothetical protein
MDKLTVGATIELIAPFMRNSWVGMLTRLS